MPPLRTLLAASLFAAAFSAAAADPNRGREAAGDPRKVLRYAYLARPPKLKPNTVEALPEISADGMTYTFKVKPGIYFADDTVFKGKKRELVAQDYVYTLKRLLDPKVRASQLGEIEPTVVGAAEVLAKARKTNTFDYDAPVE